MTSRQAIKAINEKGALLVFPINNQKEPPSLWSSFFPRRKMVWEWDESGDNKIGELWILREELSRSNKVIYAKWYRDRATFFSIPLFISLLRVLETASTDSQALTPGAQTLLETLEMDSPLSTKGLKRAADMQGKYNEGAYSRAMKELWRRLLIVGYGELDEGAFPSLLVGATKNIYEDLYLEAKGLSLAKAEKNLATLLPPSSPFKALLDKTTAQMRLARN